MDSRVPLVDTEDEEWQQRQQRQQHHKANESKVEHRPALQSHLAANPALAALERCPYLKSFEGGEELDDEDVSVLEDGVTLPLPPSDNPPPMEEKSLPEPKPEEPEEDLTSRLMQSASLSTAHAPEETCRFPAPHVTKETNEKTGSVDRDASVIITPAKVIDTYRTPGQPREWPIPLQVDMGGQQPTTTPAGAPRPRSRSPFSPLRLWPRSPRTSQTETSHVPPLVTTRIVAADTVVRSPPPGAAAPPVSSSSSSGVRGWVSKTVDQVKRVLHTGNWNGQPDESPQTTTGRASPSPQPRRARDQ